jgi:hypothetical protein
VVDDVVLIAARAEAAAVAAQDHHRAHLVEAIELLEGLGQLAVALEGERVQALRSRSA